MFGKRKRSVYRKSRKRLGFVGVQKQALQASENNQSSSSDHEDVDSDSDSQMSDFGDTLADKDATTSQSEETPTPISASRRKLSQHSCLGAPKDVVEEGIDDQTSAYRLVDIQQLSSAVFDIHKCREGRPHDLFLTCKILLVKFKTIS